MIGAKTARLNLTPGYIKEARTTATGPVFTRGGLRALRRALYRQVIKAAKRAQT